MKQEERFFNFLKLAPRAEKPRKTGLTSIGDEGDPVSWVNDMLDIWGDYVDSAKFVRALLMMPNKIVEERVKLYRDYKLDVALDDPIFAIAYYQRRSSFCAPPGTWVLPIARSTRRTFASKIRLANAWRMRMPSVSPNSATSSG